jgi:hypothetical protein
MTEQEAQTIRQGNIVIYGGQPHRVESIRVRGIAAPYFRMTNLKTLEGVGLTSYRGVWLPQDP